MANLKAVSLFSGAGGFDLGIEAAGFNTLFAADIDSACCQTLHTNKETARGLDLPFLQEAKIFERCVRKLEAADILTAIDMNVGEVDLLIGGPPCQSFSVIGPRNGKRDPRGKLLDDYLRLLAGIAPKVFIFENVKGIKTLDGGDLYSDLLETMRQPPGGLRYELSEFCLNASDYGVPQNRERVFIIGCKHGGKVSEISMLSHSAQFRRAGCLKRRTVSDALRGLPKAGAAYPANHQGRKHSTRIANRYAALKPGERDPKTRINKLDLSKPGFTIVAGSARSGGKGHIHPTEPREVTPRESARIQTFPDWWKFEGSAACDARRQIGNAVPPLLAAVIANEIRYTVFRKTRHDHRFLLEKLDQMHLLDDS